MVLAQQVKASAVINLQQKFDGSVSDSAAGTALSWQLTGTWKTATRFEGIFSGSANAAGRRWLPRAPAATSRQ